jgi:hypothetical protein
MHRCVVPSSLPRRPIVAAALITLCAPSTLQSQVSVATGRAADHDALIRVFSPSGSVRIIAWDRDSVAARGRVDSTAGRFVISGAGPALKLGVETTASQAPSGTADLELRVPARSRLRVQSRAAEIEVTANGGSIEVAGGSGRVRIEGRAAEVSVETLDGNVELALQSDVGRARTASGTIVVRGIIRDLDAITVSGPLLIGMEGRIARAHLETVSSEIAFKGDLDPDGRLEAETHSGDVELRLPVRLGAAYHLVSYGGELMNDLVPPGQARRGPGKGEWTFQTGDGRATVNVTTFKGRITLKVRGEGAPTP